MSIKNISQIATFLLAAMFVGNKCLGQVDPAWLKSWNEAQTKKPKVITSSGRIAAENEPGVPMVISGLVFKPDGEPASGVVIHAYQRDRDGFEFGPNDNALTTWRLNGWVQTDANGRFEFQTIRPAPDHLGREGAHIHFTLESVEFGRQWAPKIFFSDDPRVTDHQRRLSKKEGEFGWILDARVEDDVQKVLVKFRLREEPDF